MKVSDDFSDTLAVTTLRHLQCFLGSFTGMENSKLTF